MKYALVKGTDHGLVPQLDLLVNSPCDKCPVETDYADTLSPYGVSARYPNELFLEDRHAKEAIRFADEILQWVKGIINAVK